MEKIVSYLNLVRGMRGTQLVYVIRRHVEVALIPHGSGTYLNLDVDMIIRAPIVKARMNIKLSQNSLDRICLEHQPDTFKNDDAMVYQIPSKVFTDMVAYVYVKQSKATQNDQAVFFDIHNHVARQAADAEEKLQNSHYDGERKTWD